MLFTILASLFVALTVIPFLASRLLKDDAPAAGASWFRRFVARFDEFAEHLLARLMAAIHRVYGPALHYALGRPRTAVIAAAPAP